MLSPFDQAKRGIWLRNHGKLAGAEAAFLHLTQAHPELPYGWQELGVLYNASGQYARALRYYRKAFDVCSNDMVTLKHLALHLVKLQMFDEADAVLEEFTAASVADSEQVCVWRELLAYLRQWPLEAALAIANRMERSTTFLDVRGVEAIVLNAVRKGRPLAIVRVGDGEGAWTFMDHVEEARHAALYGANRRAFLGIWFGDDRLMHDRSFATAMREMQASLAEADIVGLPYSLRIFHEYRISSHRGIPSSVNLLRAQIASGYRGHTCSQDIHLELHKHGFFRRLFAEKVRFGVISCHDGLADLLRISTGANVARVHLTPQEKAFSNVLGDSSIRKDHFPDVYDEIVSAVRQASQQGHVWIVAAGVLGKVYCREIRRNGGIALDVGSIVDGWLGKITRPTLHNIKSFRL